ncbi:MAG: hypothetical protein AABZ29_05185 [Gemmatimonadota bacterium]
MLDLKFIVGIQPSLDALRLRKLTRLPGAGARSFQLQRIHMNDEPIG